MGILSDKIVTTRKRHMCNPCMRYFDAGSKMRTQVIKYDDIYTFRTCVTCDEITKLQDMSEDGILYEGYVLNSLREGQTPEMLLAELSPTPPETP